MGKRGWTFTILVLLAIAAGGFALVRSRSHSSDEEERQTAVVTRGELRRTVGGIGSLAPGRQVAVSFSSSDVVAEVFVEEGQSVAAGDPLAVLGTRGLELDLASARAELASAEGSLAGAQADLAALEAGPTANEVEQVRLSLESAKNSLWGTQASRDGICGRVERGMGQQYECDSAESSVHRGEAAVRQAELELEDLVAGASEQERIAARNKVTQARAGLIAAQARVEEAALLLDRATIASPITGTVTAVHVVAGERVAADAAAIEVSDLAALDVDISLDETDVAEVEVGQAALVSLDAFPDEVITGTVKAVSVVATTSSGVVLYPITVGLGPAPLAVRPGMTADVDIVLASAEEALIVPLRAVISGPGGSSIVMRVQPSGGANDEGAGEPMGAHDSGAGAAPRPAAGTPGAFGGPMPLGTPGALGSRERRMAAWSQELGGGVATAVQVVIGLTNESHAQILSGLAEGDVVVVQASASSSSGEFRPGGMGGPDGGMGGMIFRVP